MDSLSGSCHISLSWILRHLLLVFRARDGSQRFYEEDDPRLEFSRKGENLVLLLTDHEKAVLSIFQDMLQNHVWPVVDDETVPSLNSASGTFLPSGDTCFKRQCFGYDVIFSLSHIIFLRMTLRNTFFSVSPQRTNSLQELKDWNQAGNCLHLPGLSHVEAVDVDENVTHALHSFSCFTPVNLSFFNPGLVNNQLWRWNIQASWLLFKKSSQEYQNK